MKHMLPLILAGLLGIPASLSAQKADQSTLYNELFVGYGAASVYYFKTINHDYNNASISTNGDPTSAGTFFAGYDRSITKLFHVGIIFSYTNVRTPVQGYIYPGDVIYQGTSYDNLLGMVARVKLAYVNKPALQIYSAGCIGIAVDLNKADFGTISFTQHKLKPAGELVMMGIRGGRKLGGFLEFGFGTNGIVKAGVSYKFGTE
jgi:hypothetical protein